MRRTFPARLLFSLVLLAFVLPFTLLPGAAAQGAKETVAVRSVTADAERGTVTVGFDGATGNGPVYRLDDGIRFFPPVEVKWFQGERKGSNGVVLKGGFKPGKKYRLVVPSDYDWGPVRIAKGTVEFAVPDLAPSILFSDQGAVVERDSRQMVPVTVTNAGSVAAEVLRVPPALVPALLPPGQGGAGFDYRAAKKRVEAAWGALGENVRSRSSLAPFLSAPPLESRSVFFPGAERNVRKSFSLPLSFRAEKEKGAVVALSVRSDEGSAVPSDTRLLRVTDLSIAYKAGGRSLLAWVTSLRTGLPVPAVSILGLTADGVAVPLGTTGKDGILLVRTEKGKGFDGVRLLPGEGKGREVGLEETVPLEALRFLAAASEGDGTFVRLGGDAAVVADWVTAEGKDPSVPSDRSVRAAGSSRAPRRGPAASAADRAGSPLRNTHLFTERGVYRPGDEVHLRATAREYRDGAVLSPQGASLELSVTNPRGETVLRKDLALSEFGTASDTLVTKASWPQGTYTAKVAFPPGAKAAAPAPAPAPPPADEEGEEGEGEEGDSGESAPAAATGEGGSPFTATFELAEFRAPRHFAAIEFRKETVRDEAYVNVVKEETRLRAVVTGTYYAGGAVKGGRVRWKLSYAPTRFKAPPGLSDYAFGHALDRTEEFLESGEATLDDKGSAELLLPLSAEVLSGRYGVKVEAAVVDFDGRVAAESAVWQSSPKLLVGLSAHDESVRAGEGQALRIVVADEAGKRIRKGTVTAEVSRKQYLYVRKRNDQGNLYWSWEEAFRRVGSTTLSLEGGEAILDLDFATWGTHVVRVTCVGPGGEEASSSTAYEVSGGYGYDADGSARRRSFEKLVATADRKRYAPGDKAVVRFSPHRKLASLLFTVEREGILEARLVDPSVPRPSAEVELSKRHEPNVYATLLGTVARGDFPSYTGEFDSQAPAFLYGCVPLDVKSNAATLSVAVAPEEPDLTGAPGEGRTIGIRVRDGAGKGVSAEIAVAVVDEAVLALTGYRTPTLDNLAKFTVPLSVKGGDARMELLRQIFYGFVRNEPLTGGDGEAGAVIKARRDFRAVAFFDPAVRTDESGHASVSFTLPDSTTTYRVFAVACDRGAGFASAQRPLLVTKEFFVEAGLPRFLTRGDTFRLLLSANNRTSNSGKGTFTAAGDRIVPLSLPEASLEMKGNDRALLPVTGEAREAGTASFRFTGAFGGKSDAVETTIPVRSGYVTQSDHLFGTFVRQGALSYAFPPGTEKIPFPSLPPSELSAVVTLSGSPFLRIAPGLRYLLHYPYGCVEQTSSAVLPLAALRSLAAKGFLPGIGAEETDRFLEKGVSRLLSMQNESGGFGYWPGDREASDWGTVYAASALVAARDAGQAVPAEAVEKAVRFLRQRIREGGEGGDKGLVGYALWLAAKAGMAKDPADAEGYRSLLSVLDRMPRESALLYLHALKVASLLPDEEIRKRARPILERPRGGKEGGWFRAAWREPAVSLLLATSLFPDDDLTKRLAAGLLGGVNRQGYWSSTSDTGWALLALSEHFGRSSFPAEAATVTIEQEGWPPTTVTVPPGGSHEYVLEASSFLKSPRVSLSSPSAGTLSYLLSLSFPRTDLSKEGAAKGIRVAREVAPLDGKKEIRVGDVVKVTVTLDRPEGSRWDEYAYVVLDDPLPAGLEAVNTAFRSEESVPGKKTEGTWWSYWDEESRTYRFVPDRFEVRDDRVVAFRNSLWMGREPYRFSYYARAVLEGTFVVPPTKVQLMYDPSVEAYTPASTLTVLGK